jgi:hypothetical protein
VVRDSTVAAGSRAAAAPVSGLIPSLLRAIDMELVSGEPAGRTFVALLDELASKGANDGRSGAAYQ